ncbi:hypothetical protein WKR88_19305 [Trinickia caryophylli]|uniref:Uncharacterized protein n=1 Tax=Trinickia caryophylli TaxID=28094 RepID=A0A1X7DEV0_TRICW|nr:hypothetical protein [Trinickia caryophylli]WQE12382.1 hypothetical protein U0034_02865 [Trinickia caryophylli]GLU31470.1 hypothetical protein Busp01_13120 [Trinickia caryophylli]SMF14326.1 hypothetical protein SAMN06295900_10399 [Trinickia caryophylli]
MLRAINFSNDEIISHDMKYCCAAQYPVGTGTHRREAREGTGLPLFYANWRAGAALQFEPC